MMFTNQIQAILSAVCALFFIGYGKPVEAGIWILVSHSYIRGFK